MQVSFYQTLPISPSDDLKPKPLQKVKMNKIQKLTNKIIPNIIKYTKVIILISGSFTILIDKILDYLYWRQDIFYFFKGHYIKNAYTFFLFVGPIIQLICMLTLSVKQDLPFKIISFFNSKPYSPPEQQQKTTDFQLLSKQSANKNKYFENIHQIYLLIKEAISEYITLRNIQLLILSIPFSILMALSLELRLLPFIIFYYLHTKYQRVISKPLLDSFSSQNTERKKLGPNELEKLGTIQIQTNVHLPIADSLLMDAFLVSFLNIIDLSTSLIEGIGQASIQYINNNYMNLWSSESPQENLLSYASFCLGIINLFFNGISLLQYLYLDFIEKGSSMNFILKTLSEDKTLRLQSDIGSALILTNVNDMKVLQYLLKEKQKVIKYLILDFKNTRKFNLYEEKQISQGIKQLLEHKQLATVEIKNVDPIMKGFSEEPRESIYNLFIGLFNLNVDHSIQIVMDEKTKDYYTEFIKEECCQGVNQMNQSLLADYRLVDNKISFKNSNIDQEFINCQNFSSLRVSELDLQGNILTDKKFKKLANCQYKQQLTKINLQGNKLGPLSIYNLKQMELKMLIELNLANNEIKDDGCQILSEANLIQLEKLVLSQNQITHDGIISLTIKVQFQNGEIQVGLKNYQKKEFFNILFSEQDSNEQKQFQTLVKSPFQKLSTLIVDNNSINHKGVRAIFACNNTNLQEIDISYNNIKQEIIILNKNSSENVKIFTSNNNNFGSKGFEKVPRCIPNVQILSLNASALSSIGELTSLSKLENLSLSSNKILEIDSLVFQNMKNLQILDLSRNQLKLINQSSFSSLQKLENLILLRNQLDNLNENVFANQINMKLLDLTDNLLTELPVKLFERLGKLEILIIKNNRINDIDEGLLNNCQCLTNLDLSINKMKELRRGDLIGLSKLNQFQASANQLKIFDCDVFNDLQSVDTIDLSNNQIDSLNSTSASQSNKLQNLYLQKNQIVNIDAQVFISFPTLMHLNLANNKISFIDPMLFSPLTILLQLELQYNKITIISPNTFRELKSLHNLIISNNLIDNLNSDSFQGLSQLKQLDISDNKISSLKPNLFSQLQNLLSLQLQGNKFSTMDDGCFSGLLKLNNLDLSENKIEILDTPVFNPLHNLVNLNISNNKIKQIQYKMFYNLNSLKQLDLSSNQLTNLHGKTFSKLFCLRTLSINENQINIIQENQFKYQQGIEDLNLSKNQIGKESKWENLSHLTNLKNLYLGENQLEENILSQLKVKLGNILK